MSEPDNRAAGLGRRSWPLYIASRTACKRAPARRRDQARCLGVKRIAVRQRQTPVSHRIRGRGVELHAIFLQGLQALRQEGQGILLRHESRLAGSSGTDSDRRATQKTDHVRWNAQSWGLRQHFIGPSQPTLAMRLQSMTHRLQFWIDIMSQKCPKSKRCGCRWHGGRAPQAAPQGRRRRVGSWRRRQSGGVSDGIRESIPAAQNACHLNAPVKRCHVGFQRRLQAVQLQGQMVALCDQAMPQTVVCSLSWRMPHMSLSGVVSEVGGRDAASWAPALPPAPPCPVLFDRRRSP